MKKVPKIRNVNYVRRRIVTVTNTNTIYFSFCCNGNTYIRMITKAVIDSILSYHAGSSGECPTTSTTSTTTTTTTTTTPAPSTTPSTESKHSKHGMVFSLIKRSIAVVIVLHLNLFFTTCLSHPLRY